MKSPRFYVYCMLYGSLFIIDCRFLIVRVSGSDTDGTIIKRRLSSLVQIKGSSLTPALITSAIERLHQGCMLLSSFCSAIFRLFPMVSKILIARRKAQNGLGAGNLGYLLQWMCEEGQDRVTWRGCVRCFPCMGEGKYALIHRHLKAFYYLDLQFSELGAWLSSLTAHCNHLGGLKNIDTWVPARDSDILG